ncbi:MAG: GNAT family N-acetyltransferase [Bdellovibrionales bacterium]|nr:GNAT family N-acetyltransferase [Bdellovibrionales bacterium]
MEIRLLNEGDEKVFFQGMKAWEGDDLTWYTFAWKPGMSFQQMLKILDDEKAGRNLQPGRVAHTMFYGFVDDEIIGRLSIRHELNDYLFHRGGNVGYSVAPKFRGKGYATQMMKHALEYCRDELKLQKILVTCNDTNIASWKVIEKAGGVLEKKFVDDTDGALVRRYWFQLTV